MYNWKAWPPPPMMENRSAWHGLGACLSRRSSFVLNLEINRMSQVSPGCRPSSWSQPSSKMMAGGCGKSKIYGDYMGTSFILNFKDLANTSEYTGRISAKISVRISGGYSGRIYGGIFAPNLLEGRQPAGPDAGCGRPDGRTCCDDHDDERWRALHVASRLAT